jgi:hypothetical protein
MPPPPPPPPHPITTTPPLPHASNHHNHHQRVAAQASTFEPATTHHRSVDTAYVDDTVWSVGRFYAVLLALACAALVLVWAVVKVLWRPVWMLMVVSGLSLLRRGDHGMRAVLIRLAAFLLQLLGELPSLFVSAVAVYAFVRLTEREEAASQLGPAMTREDFIRRHSSSLNELDNEGAADDGDFSDAKFIHRIAKAILAKAHKEVVQAEDALPMTYQTSESCSVKWVELLMARSDRDLNWVQNKVWPQLFPFFFFFFFPSFGFIMIGGRRGFCHFAGSICSAVATIAQGRRFADP